MLGDVGCKMGPRWVQEEFESEFFAQLGVLMGILAPRWQDKALQDESEGLVKGGPGWCMEGPGTFWGRPAAEAWPLRVHQSQTWSQILLSYHGLQHPVGAAPDLKASASAAGPLALRKHAMMRC